LTTRTTRAIEFFGDEAHGKDLDAAGARVPSGRGAGKLPVALSNDGGAGAIAMASFEEKLVN
jgi:hypothetical protein